ncbi:MAG: endonuclease domain-containing protein [Maricaulis sp.]|nr:endonuclease domain-containing protein [Maricaulis sp.]MBO6796866.1 endonuclease domain-containing protein [Maricaulis sp.]
MNQKLTNRARELRRNQTDAELRLWGHLRGRRLLGAKFRRQVPIGRYIVDFLCKELGLIVEADGGQHTEQEIYDARRTARLEAQGYTVIRFWNVDIMLETDAVLEAIADSIRALRAAPSSPFFAKATKGTSPRGEKDWRSSLVPLPRGERSRSEA